MIASSNHVNSTKDVDCVVVEEREFLVLEEVHLVAATSSSIAEVLETNDVDLVTVEERE